MVLLNKTIKHVFVITILFTIAICCYGQSNSNQGISDMEKLDSDPELQKYVLKLTFAANNFRMTASSDFQKALEKYCTQQCQQEWHENFQKYFIKQKIHLADFFSGAILLLGRFDND